MVRTNSGKAWLLAARPKTLTGALAPVIVGLSAAWAQQGRLDWCPAVLCGAFALLMQVDANLINDYLDFRDGIDREDRLGPERACQQGWITPRAMQWGIGLVTLLACLAGLPLVLWGGWWMVAIGLACVAGCALYSTLARLALGDVLVVLFFGLVPVMATYYLQVCHDLPLDSMGHFPSSIFCSALWDACLSKNFQLLSAALAMGLVTDCLLLVNNYRDRDTDRRVGKRTLVTLVGPKATEWLYLSFGLIAFALCLPQSRLLLFYLPFHFSNWQLMRTIHEGRALNAILGRTAASILLFAVLYSVGVIWSI